MSGKYIPKTTAGRRFAIADIHGCFETLRALVETQIQLTRQDQLFLLGDYLDRGPKPVQVLDYIIDLQQDKYQLFPLRGNHEQMVIASRLERVVPPYQEFLRKLLYFYETADFYLVHAGFNFHALDPLTDLHAMLWSRDQQVDPEFLNNRKIVYGHTIHTLTDIRYAAEERDILLPLDNGCFLGLDGYTKGGEYGNLCALNLDTFELLVQKNVDEKK